MLLKQTNGRGTQTGASSSTVSDLMICERCGKRLLAWDLPDHMDFHFAKDLQDSLREKSLFTMCGTNNSVSSSNCKKRGIENSSPKKRQQTSKKFKTNSTGGSDVSNNHQLSRYFSPVKRQQNEL